MFAVFEEKPHEPSGHRRNLSSVSACEIKPSTSRLSSDADLPGRGLPLNKSFEKDQSAINLDTTAMESTALSNGKILLKNPLSCDAINVQEKQV